MKVATRLSVAFTGLVLILAGLLIYHVRMSRSAVMANFELAALSSRVHQETSRKVTAINQLEEAAEKFWVTRDDGYLQLFEQAFTEFEAALGSLRAGAETPSEQEEVERLERIWTDFGELAAAVGGDLLLSDPPAAALSRQLSALRLQSRRAADASQDAMRGRLEATATAAERAERVSWIVGAATLLLTVLVFILIVRSISNGLNRLHAGARQVAAGNFDYRLDAENGDEFGQLAREFNEMTQKLGELDRMKRSFLSKVSHDLKTPLASMRETVGVMLDGVPGPITDRQRLLLELTNQSGERLSSMIAKILDLSAMEAGAIALELQDNEATALIDAAVAAFAPEVPGRDSRIRTNGVSEGLMVTCDRDRTVQVLVNLLENSLKFSPDNEPVVVGVRMAGAGDPGVSEDGRGWVVFEVRDRGPGIPAEERSRIFEDYFQAGARDRRPGSGVGLGLAICREIVDLHGGSIRVGENPGGGSVFTVLLPKAKRRVKPVRSGVELLVGEAV